MLSSRSDAVAFRRRRDVKECGVVLEKVYRMNSRKNMKRVHSHTQKPIPLCTVFPTPANPSQKKVCVCFADESSNRMLHTPQNSEPVRHHNDRLIPPPNPSIAVIQSSRSKSPLRCPYRPAFYERDRTRNCESLHSPTRSSGRRRREMTAFPDPE